MQSYIYYKLTVKKVKLVRLYLNEKDLIFFIEKY